MCATSVPVCPLLAAGVLAVLLPPAQPLPPASFAPARLPLDVLPAAPAGVAGGGSCFTCSLQRRCTLPHVPGEPPSVNILYVRLPARSADLKMAATLGSAWAPIAKLQAQAYRYSAVSHIVQNHAELERSQVALSRNRRFRKLRGRQQQAHGARWGQRACSQHQHSARRWPTAQFCAEPNQQNMGFNRFGRLRHAPRAVQRVLGDTLRATIEFPTPRLAARGCAGD